MLPSLHRWSFIDVEWDRVAFDDLAEFWVRTFAQERPAGAPFTTRARVHVWGFPRADGPLVLAELTQRLGAAGVAVNVSMPDADTVQVEAPGPVLGALVAALDAPSARGLVVELSLALADPDETGAPTDRAQKPARAPAAVVVAVGEIIEGRVRVRGFVAHRGRAPNPEEWSASNRNEAHLLREFETFRHLRGVAAGLLPRLLKLGARQPEPQFSEDAARTPLWWLWARVARALAPFLIGVGIANSWPDLGLVLRIVGLYLCVCVFSDEVRKWRYGYGSLKEHYDAPFRKALRYALLDPKPVLSSEDMERLSRELATVGLYASPVAPILAELNDACVRKLTADLVAAGFVHDGDAAETPHARATSVYRFFRAPDGRSYLVVGFTFGWREGFKRGYTWPASVLVTQCQTFFADGTRLETCTQSDPLSTLGRGAPTATWNTIPDDTPPLECYALHQKALAERTAASESPAVKHVSLEQFVAIQNRISAEQHAAYWRRPYGLRDHLWWYLGYDRPK